MDYKKFVEHPDFSSLAKVAEWVETAATVIVKLLARAEAAEARCKRLDEARENANEAAAKWEGLYHMAETRCATLEKMVKEYQEELVPGYRERAEKAERERDAAIKRLRETCWCAGCEHFKGLDGCQLGSGEECSPENDRYKFAVKEE